MKDKIIKLQLKVKVCNDILNTETNTIDKYCVFFSFLDLDELFETTLEGKRYISFCCRNGFRIRSVWDEPFGDIRDDGIIIPKLDKIGISFKKVFDTDEARYEYLKDLYTALKEWSNYWEGFIEDDNSIIFLKDDIWTVFCYKKRRLGFNKRIDHRHPSARNLIL